MDLPYGPSCLASVGPSYEPTGVATRAQSDPSSRCTPRCRQRYPFCDDVAGPDADIPPATGAPVTSDDIRYRQHPAGTTSDDNRAPALYRCGQKLAEPLRRVAPFAPSRPARRQHTPGDSSYLYRLYKTSH